MKTKLNKAILLVLPVMLSACAATTPRWDQEFGTAVRASIASQQFDPAAVRNPNPVTGIDGLAAHEAQRDYVGSFGRPAATSPVTNDGTK